MFLTILNWGGVFEPNQNISHGIERTKRKLVRKIKRDMEFAFKFYQADAVVGKRMAFKMEKRISIKNKMLKPYLFFNKGYHYLKRKLERKD